MKRLGILTSGGDAPGMNAAIRAAVRTASTRGIGVVGYVDGYTGFVKGEYIELDDRAVGNQIQRGGTFIGTSRCPEFRDPTVRAQAAEKMLEADVEGLIVVGGDGSFRGARALELEQGVPVAGIPGTIDNDVFGTDETIGFHTAVNTAVLAIDQLRDTGESTGMMFFVEVMGRTSGAIALHTAVAAGAAAVVVPEGGDFQELVDRLETSIARGKRSHVIVVAEGERAGGAFKVAERVGRLLNRPYRVVVLGHVQRGGRPSPRDRIVAALSGALAVEALANGRSGMMIGMQRGQAVEVPLRDVVDNVHPDPPYELLQLAQMLSG
ncbi:MAG: ATP-dependent 6-phosphofructokinase [Dehalococcoidia bacterium]|nr:ATP-dependent 6-phosphofructokinase [Dehalococcoidia bacterium]